MIKRVSFPILIFPKRDCFNCNSFLLERKIVIALHSLAAAELTRVYLMKADMLVMVGLGDIVKGFSLS